MAEVGRAAGAGDGDVARAAVQPLASIATSARAAPTLSMPLSSSNAAAIACYAEPIVNEAEIVPSPLRRRLENDPWARTLGIEIPRRTAWSLQTPSATPITHGQALLVAEAHEVKQGRRAGFYQMSVATEDGRAVASAHAVAHRLTS